MWPTNITHVDQVLYLLSKNKCFLKQSKFSFGVSEVEYLGHIVGKDGVRVDPNKIEAMQDWHPLKNINIFHGFLGLNWLLSQVCSKLWKNCGPPNSSP